MNNIHTLNIQHRRFFCHIFYYFFNLVQIGKIYSQSNSISESKYTETFIAIKLKRKMYISVKPHDPSSSNGIENKIFKWSETLVRQRRTTDGLET